jgi:fatty-acyl-CoA synthase
MLPAGDTVWARFEKAAHATPDANAFTDLSNGGSQALSYSELLDHSLRTAAWLAERGVQRGSVVATLLPNCRTWVETFLATARLGALLVPLNTRYRTQELSHLLRVAEAEVLVTASEFEGVDFAERLRAVADLGHDQQVPVRHVVSVAGDLEQLPDRWNRFPASDLINREPLNAAPNPRPDDPLIVFGTSGTTSAPKLAVHTHRTTALQATSVAQRLEFSAGPAALQVLSLSGTFGFVPFVSALLVGKPTVLLPIFKLSRVLHALQVYNCDLLVAPEGPVRDLLDVLTNDNVGELRRIVTAGLDIADIVSASATIGIEASNVYGSSEVFAFAAIARPGAPTEDRLVPGGELTAPGASARVRDPETGRVLPAGEVGELEIGGDTLFIEYLHNPTTTAESRTADGWFRTGDSAVLLGERRFRYLARAGDTLRLGGYTVSPADIESTIEQLPVVAQAQVVGVRQPRTGHDHAVAFVRPRPGSVVEPDDVKEHCRARLASFKVPVHIEIVDAFPTTPSANGDKVRRDMLRELASQMLEPGFSI